MSRQMVKKYHISHMMLGVALIAVICFAFGEQLRFEALIQNAARSEARDHLEPKTVRATHRKLESDHESYLRRVEGEEQMRLMRAAAKDLARMKATIENPAQAQPDGALEEE